MKIHKTDKQLVEEAIQGSNAAFKQLFDKYWNDLYSIAYKRLHSHEDVKDILQEVFISVWKNLKHLSVDESLGGYLYTCLKNKILNFYEKDKVRLRVMMEAPFDPVESEKLIYSALYTVELQEVVKTIIASMPEKMREIYLLSKEKQLTNAEICNLLTVAPQTVKNQLHKAISRIREGLKEKHLHYFLFLF